VGKKVFDKQTELKQMKS